jgi:hypothetical protein
MFPGQPPPMSSPPSVVVWARVYAIAFAFMYLLCIVGGILLVVMGESFGGRDSGETVVQGAIMAIVGVPLMVVSFIAALAPRKKWGWVMNVVLMGLGCSSCMCMPAAIPLLIFWLKPEVKAWYGMG